MGRWRCQDDPPPNADRNEKQACDDETCEEEFQARRIVEKNLDTQLLAATNQIASALVKITLKTKRSLTMRAECSFSVKLNDVAT